MTLIADRHVINYLQAVSADTLAGIAQELLIQCHGVTRDNASDTARDSLIRLKNSDVVYKDQGCWVLRGH